MMIYPESDNLSVVEPKSLHGRDNICMVRGPRGKKGSSTSGMEVDLTLLHRSFEHINPVQIAMRWLAQERGTELISGMIIS